ncbi:hypothetical protein AZE42_14085, partial [Rhizopogon vesiculosus]
SCTVKTVWTGARRREPLSSLVSRIIGIFHVNVHDADEDEDNDSEKDTEEGNEVDEHEVPAATPFEAYVDDEVANEMDGYTYSGPDRVVHEDDENAFGPEDGEDVVHEFEE